MAVVQGHDSDCFYFGGGVPSVLIPLQLDDLSEVHKQITLLLIVNKTKSEK